MYVGRALDLAMHSTSVACLVVGLDQDIGLTSDTLGTVATRSALVPPRTKHRVVANGRILFCYFDIDSAWGRDCASRMARSQGGFGLGHRAESDLIRLATDPELDPDQVVTVAAGPAPVVIDPRIRSVVAAVRELPERSADVAELAAHVALSPAYLQRLFKSETGTSLRRYRLWARMHRVAEEVADGSDLTAAAMAAGFASPSHFSDAFRRMFGLSPTALIASGAELIVRQPVA